MTATLSKTAERRLLAKQEWDLAPEAERALTEFTENWNDALDPLRDDLVAALEAGEFDPSALDTLRVDVERTTRNYTSDLQEVYRVGTEQGAHAGRAIAARQHQLDVAFDVVPQDVLEEFAEWSDEIVDSEVIETITEDVTNYVRGAQEQGLSIDDIADGINEDVFDNRLQDHVATRNARTATISSSNAGKDSTYRDGEGVVGTEWLTGPRTSPNAPRPSHANASGQIVGTETKFIVGSSTARYPGDPTLPVDEIVNCRCTSIPVFADQLTDDELSILESGGRIGA